MNPQPPEAAFYHFNAPAARIIVLDGSNIVCFAPPLFVVQTSASKFIIYSQPI